MGLSSNPSIKTSHIPSRRCHHTPMTTAKLRDLQSIDDVARACGVEADFIREYSESANQQSHYEILKLPKKGKRRQGEYRVVFAAWRERLRQLHRGLAMVVSNSANFGIHVQGFVKKRSTRSNAEQHIGAKTLLHADIKGFFDAITTQHVQTAFVEHGATLLMAEILAKACTIDGLLRQGTRCSPTVANLVCFSMDAAFLRLAAATGSTYSRYADDIVFSGASVPRDDSVRAILQSCGFELRDGQCFHQRRGRVQYVTGLSVADPSQPRLPRRLKNQLRLVMHYIGKYGLDDHFDRSKQSDTEPHVVWLDGLLSYARSIEPNLVDRWQRVFDAALAQRVRKNASDAMEEDCRL